MVLPVFCYVLGMFASMTVLMKNSLMENLGQDYVRTAFAKGLSEKTVIFKHALRNSLIPIATGLGHMLSLILAGSYLIEKVFNIKGFGLLGYESLIARDYPVTLGILVIGSLLKLFGNIFSDILYCIIDPRIRFS
jgi:microcin C transport system permease protein